MEKAIREGYTGRGCGCGCGGVCVSAMEHIQFCTYFFFLRAGPGGGGGYKPTPHFKYAVETGGFGKPVSKHDVRHAKFPELAEEGRPRVRRFSPPAAGAATRLLPRAAPHPRRLRAAAAARGEGQGSARALRGVFLPMM